MKTTRFPDVMVLAAGLGKRMRPLTDKTPKPLIEVGGKPLIDRVVANAYAEGATRFAVNAHHHADQVTAHIAALQASITGTTFQVSLEEDVLLDTGGGIKRALPLLGTDPFLVMNADSFWPTGPDRPLGRMIERFDPRATGMVLLCAHPHAAVGFRRSHDFCLDPRGLVTKDAGAPVIYAGVALVARALFGGVEDDMFSFFDLIERCLDDGRLAGVALDAPWFHVGDVQSIAETEQKLPQ